MKNENTRERIVELIVRKNAAVITGDEEKELGRLLAESDEREYFNKLMNDEQQLIELIEMEGRQFIDEEGLLRAKARLFKRIDKK